MTDFVKNMIWNSVSGFVEEGKRTVGGFAGDALIKAGDMVEGGGRTVGNGIEKKATGLGTAIGGAPPKAPSAKALPSTARRPAAHRSSSLPANTKPKAPVGGSGVPLGAKKTPAGAAAGAAAVKRAAGSGVPLGAKKTPANGALPKFTPKPFNPPGGVSKPSPYPTSGGKPNASTSSLPKAYPSSGTGGAGNPLPKPYPGAGSKTPVRPGQSKPFSGAATSVGGAVKPYPGTNTLPGQASKKPVQKYKPAQRYEPPAKAGEVKSFF
ncbi:hypothetical protein DPSP01_002548 [Paraphaeosphaeria sporulosa]|uniref:Uncharacterized protein n=1 Tax=Paraphaeosphaeria sporulosa TaxID=1460663 RepID=A0A177CXJ3_9PLEO|nr:uncharacterized protein CC84DRAFT_1253905 [Paraphaeosphaeria sporulosa]OAG11439.1 hypothetical protein CC84DRAFT_1253905 [Paraphaeosphaeria sporulosa]